MSVPRRKCGTVERSWKSGLVVRVAERVIFSLQGLQAVVRPRVEQGGQHQGCSM